MKIAIIGAKHQDIGLVKTVIKANQDLGCEVIIVDSNNFVDVVKSETYTLKNVLADIDVIDPNLP